MQKKRLFICLLGVLMLVAALGISPTLAQTPVEVAFWHAMSGNNGKVVTDLVAAYNASNFAFRCVSGIGSNSPSFWHWRICCVPAIPPPAPVLRRRVRLIR